MATEISKVLLDNRGILRVAGPDAEDFLQGLITQDVSRLSDTEKLLYSALLTPQGGLLHDFFIFRKDDGIFLDCEQARRSDLLHRMGLYRMRAKVSIEDVSPSWRVYATTENLQTAFDDPRPSMKAWKRVYAAADDDDCDADASPVYEDACITAGLPLGAQTFVPERDIAADINLDLLQAIAWDKGCYVGQEVTARVHFRGLAKKRLLLVKGGPFLSGEKLLQNSGEIGEIRTVASDGKVALAIMRMNLFDHTGAIITDNHGRQVMVSRPNYLK